MATLITSGASSEQRQLALRAGDAIEIAAEKTEDGIGDRFKLVLDVVGVVGWRRLAPERLGAVARHRVGDDAARVSQLLARGADVRRGGLA